MPGDGLEIILHNRGKQTRQIQTTSGKLSIQRTVQVPQILVKDESGKVHHRIAGKPIVPLDEYLHIGELPFKMSEGMMRETASWGQSQISYKMAEEMMKEKCGYDVSNEYIRQVTDHIGGQFFERDQKNADNLDKNLLETPDTHKKAGVLYIMVDGAVINTRKTGENGSTWQENKLGLVFHRNDLRKRMGKSTSGQEIQYDIMKKEANLWFDVTLLGSVDEFKKHLYVCALRNGYGQFETTVIVSDGATWIRNMADELFPDAVQILDLFHLKENIYTFAKHLHGDDPAKYVPWAESLIALAENSRTDELLGKLAKYKGMKLPPGVVNMYTYVFNNRSKIDYLAYRAHGYYVGSGPIESGNKTVLQRRCKQAGMRWNERCAQHMLTLCARAASKIGFRLRPAA